MRAILNAAGVVQAVGDDPALVVPEGGRAIETDTDPLAGLAAGQEAVWDGAKFVVRQRTLSAEEQAAKDAKALVLSAAASAVGIRFDLLTAGQVRALAAILFWRAGALNGDGTVKALGEWVRD